MVTEMRFVAPVVFSLPAVLFEVHAVTRVPMFPYVYLSSLSSTSPSGLIYSFLPSPALVAPFHLYLPLLLFVLLPWNCIYAVYRNPLKYVLCFVIHKLLSARRHWEVVLLGTTLCVSFASLLLFFSALNLFFLSSGLAANLMSDS